MRDRPWMNVAGQLSAHTVQCALSSFHVRHNSEQAEVIVIKLYEECCQRTADRCCTRRERGEPCLAVAMTLMSSDHRSPAGSLPAAASSTQQICITLTSRKVTV